MTLRYLTAGESHGPGLCAIAEGFPAGLSVDFEASTPSCAGASAATAAAAAEDRDRRGAVPLRPARRRHPRLAHRARGLEQGPRELEGARLALRPGRAQVHPGAPRPRRPGRRPQVRLRRRPRRPGAGQRPQHGGHRGAGRAGARRCWAASASRSRAGSPPSASGSAGWGSPPTRRSRRPSSPPTWAWTTRRRPPPGAPSSTPRRRAGAPSAAPSSSTPPGCRPGSAPTSTPTAASTRAWPAPCAASRPSAPPRSGRARRSSCAATRFHDAIRPDPARRFARDTNRAGGLEAGSPTASRWWCAAT